MEKKGVQKDSDFTNTPYEYYIVTVNFSGDGDMLFILVKRSCPHWSA